MRTLLVARAFGLSAAVAALFLACSSKTDKTSCDADLTFDNFSCSGACTANFSSCEIPQKNEFPISGTYTITDCSYDTASSENQRYIGGTCEGSITLCITGLHGSVEVMTYQDVGPSGVATNAAFKVYGSSCLNCDSGSTTPQQFDVIGTDTVEGNGCKDVVDVWFSCFGSLASGTWTCRKTSSVRSSTCGDSGWVHSFGHYKQSHASCPGSTSGDSGTSGDGGGACRGPGGACTLDEQCCSNSCGINVDGVCD